MKSLIALLIVLYPLFAFVQWMTDVNVLEQYHTLILNWWDWLLIGLLTYTLLKRVLPTKVILKEKIREKLFYSEFNRYSNTPFMPPVLIMYLLNPPSTLSNDLYVSVKDRFYQKVVNAFRDRVYIHADYKTPLPKDRIPFYLVVGLKDILLIAGSISVSFGWFVGVVMSDYTLFINGWERFSIPFVTALSIFGALRLQALMEMRYTGLDIDLQNILGDPYIKKTWRESFPDKELGEAIIHTWEAERERKMRYTYQARNLPVPDVIQDYFNPALAPFPFPSNEIPAWADQIEAHYESKQQEWLKQIPEKPAGNVVPLKKRRV
jgi:hypothetical protein